MWNLLQEKNFQIDFYSNLLAGIVLGVAFSIIYPRYLIWLKRPKLSLYFGRKGNRFIITEDGKWEATLNLIIFNKGKEAIRGFYYNFFIPTILNPTYQKSEPMESRATIQTFSNVDGNYKIVKGFISSPLYSGRSLRFPYEIKLKTNPMRIVDDIGIPIYFSFATEFGIYPRNAGLEDIIKEGERRKMDKLLGKIILLPPL